MEQKKFAVVLAGCGVYDGAEIQEAVATLLAIARVGARYECFAPNVPQYHVINHLNGEVSAEVRNVLVESARIARGDIKPVELFTPSGFDAVIFPGGFGVAKNLCTFAIDGPDCTVNPEIKKAVLAAYEAKLPIGALCIAPALVAKILGKSTLTIGEDEGTAKNLAKMGARHRVAHGSDIVVDLENRIVSSPCYMLDAPITTIFAGAENTIQALINLMN